MSSDNNDSSVQEQDTQARILKFAYLLLLVGSLLVAVAELLEANLAAAHRSIMLSVIFLVGLYWPTKPILPVLKKFPTGMKLLFGYFSILALLHILQALFSSFRAADILFGGPLTGLVTTLTQALPLLVLLTILAYLLKKKQWKLILALQLLLILNSLLGFTYILATPIQELSELTEQELPGGITPELEQQVKQLIMIPMLVGLSLAIAAATYTYRRKDHFEKTT